jgi:glycosyltransferase involved in cell wall biosynthesis
MKKTDQLVSIIITSKNSENFLEMCLKSIKFQSYKQIEIIIVDNNSIDKTKEIAKKYTKLIFNKGPERSAQRNFGASKAKGSYFYFVDSDFSLEKDVVKECMDQIDKGFDAIVIHNSPDISVGWIARVRKFEVDMYKYNLDHSASRFFKREVFKKINGYDEKITAGEDYDIQNRLNRKEYKTGFVNAEAIHLGEPTSFWRHMKKYYIYGRDFVNYQKKNEAESKKQLSFFRNVYTNNWQKFLDQPVLASKFIFYNLFKYVFGSVGFLVGKIENEI